LTKIYFSGLNRHGDVANNTAHWSNADKEEVNLESGLWENGQPNLNDGKCGIAKKTGKGLLGNCMRKLRSYEGHYGMRHTALWSCTHIPNTIDLSGKTKKLWPGQASLRRSRRRRNQTKTICLPSFEGETCSYDTGPTSMKLQNNYIHIEVIHGILQKF
jgi:hypothetical protein